MTHSHPLPLIPENRGRYDIYGLIHKALRKAQCDMLVRMGQADFDHDLDLLADLRALLDIGSLHISHEEVHIHTALDLRAPRTSRGLKEQHDHHRDSFRAIEALIAALEQAPAGQRREPGRQLYLSYSAFVARDFDHMLEEETSHNDALWCHFADGELMAMEGGIIAGLSPEKVIRFMQLMLPAISREERAGLLGGMKANAPAEAFTAVMELAARPMLTPADLADLEARLSVAVSVAA